MRVRVTGLLFYWGCLGELFFFGLKPHFRLGRLCRCGCECDTPSSSLSDGLLARNVCPWYARSLPTSNRTSECRPLKQHTSDSQGKEVSFATTGYILQTCQVSTASGSGASQDSQMEAPSSRPAAAKAVEVFSSLW